MTSAADDVHELTEQEHAALIEREVQRYTGMCAAEFERRWNAGEYRDEPDPAVTRVAMMMPGAWVDATRLNGR